MHTCHIRIHMCIVDIYAHICTHIQYTAQTIDYQKPKMCTSNYFFLTTDPPGSCCRISVKSRAL